jgi:hypothetical protein
LKFVCLFRLNGVVLVTGPAAVSSGSLGCLSSQRHFITTQSERDSSLKTIPLIVLLSTLTATALHAEARNDTPQALACMKKYGFTPEQWRAYAVPAEKAEPYRLCRDSGGRTDAGKVKAACLAQAGVTAQQWKNMQASEAQGAAYKSCMAGHGIEVTVRRRNGTTF